MCEKIIEFSDIEIEKQNFHQHKSPILIENIVIDKMIESNKVSFGKKSFKNFIGHKDAKKIDPISSKNKCIQKRLWWR